MEPLGNSRARYSARGWGGRRPAKRRGISPLGKPQRETNLVLSLQAVVTVEISAPTHEKQRGFRNPKRPRVNNQIPEVDPGA